MKLINKLLLLFLISAQCTHSMEQPQLTGTNCSDSSTSEELSVEQPRNLNTLIASLSCPKCNKKSFGTIPNFKNHILACCTDLKPYVCDKRFNGFPCGSKFVQSNNFRRHMDTVHKCKDASTELSLGMLKEISKTINPFLPPAWKFQCELCDDLFPLKICLINHNAKAHPKPKLDQSCKRKEVFHSEPAAPSSPLIKELKSDENIFELLEDLAVTTGIQNPFSTEPQQINNGEQNEIN